MIEAERAVLHLSRLQAATTALAGAMDSTAVARAVLEQCVEALGATSAAFGVLDETNEALQVLHTMTYPPDTAGEWTPVPLSRPMLLTDAIRHGAPIFIGSVAQLFERYPEHRDREVASAAWVAMPLKVDGHVIGGFVLGFPSERTFQVDERDLLFNLAQQCAQALERVRLYQAERRARQISERAVHRITRLQALTAALVQALTPEQVGEVIVREGLLAIEADAGAVYVLEDEGRVFRALAFSGYGEQPPARYVTVSARLENPLSEAVRSRDLVVVESVDQMLARWPRLAGAQARSGDVATITAPLLLDDQVLGVIHLGFRYPHTFSADDRVFVLTLARQCVQALERARLYEAERVARERAEAALHMRDTFLSVATHELKNPLTVLQGNAQLLERYTTRNQSLSEREQKAVRTIAEQAQRLSRLMSGLLDISRIELGQFTLDRRPVDLDALLQRILDEFRHGYGQYHFAYAASFKPATVLGDVMRLEQVFQNLMSNAVKYSPEGSTVHVQLERSGDYALVTVRDEGIGIPAPALPHLFERFYRAPNTAEHRISGTGLGLYVVKEIISRHDGTIAVESVEGAGSTFSVRLPLLASST